MGKHLHTHELTEQKSIKLALSITICFALIEIAGGIWSKSLSLFSDAIHMLADVTALGIGFFACKISSIKPSAAKSFGYKRAEVMAALINGLLLWIISGYMLSQAYQRFNNPVQILSGPMLFIAIIGLAANISSALILKSHSRHNLNVQGAFLHVVTDMLGSLGVISAGIIIHLTGYYRIDIFVSLFIISLILYSSTRLIKDTLHILMEGTPENIEIEQVEQELKKIPGVENVHELHIWSMSSGNNLLSAHLLIRDKMFLDEILKNATRLVSEKFGIKHPTFQIETEFIENSSCDICQQKSD